MPDRSFRSANWIRNARDGMVAIAAYTTPDTYQHVFVGTRGGEILQVEFSPGTPDALGLWTWNAHSVMHHDVVRGLTAYYHAGDGREHVFAATDSEVWEAMWTPGDPGDPSNVTVNWLAHLDGGIVGIAGYSTSDGHQHVFVATRTGDVRQLEMDPNVGFWSWRDPVMHHDIIRGVTAYYHPGDGREHVFAVTDTEVWEAMWSPGDPATVNWLAHLDDGIVSIAGYSTPDAHQHLFVATKANQLRQLEMNPKMGFWAWRDSVVQRPVTGVSGYFHPGDDRQHVFGVIDRE